MEAARTLTDNVVYLVCRRMTQQTNIGKPHVSHLLRFKANLKAIVIGEDVYTIFDFGVRECVDAANKI